MKWITRDNAKVDRVACPWLIKKFIDPEAEFIFVPEDEVANRAKELGATPFAMEEVESGRNDEAAAFNLLLKKHQLTDPALMLLGEIVCAADGHPSKPHPAGEGLRWLSSGFSALGLNDQEMLQRQLLVYDALYAECRRRAAYAGFF